MKKLILLISTLLTITSCSNLKKPIKEPLNKLPKEFYKEEKGNFNGHYMYEYEGNVYNLPLIFDFHFNDLISLDNNKYHKDLAKLALSLCACESNINSLKVYNSDNEIISDNFYEELGVSNLESYQLINNVGEVDKYDTTKVIMSYKEFNDKDLFFIALEATQNDDEWISNFDVGSTINYQDSSNWIDKLNHKGFDVAANRIYKEVNKYIAKKTKNTPIFFVTGYSRGAAVANIVSKMLNDEYDNKLFSYTFACPPTTLSSSYDKYTNIFNIINMDDIITQILYPYNFKRYGVDMNISAYLTLDNFYSELVTSNNKKSIKYAHSNKYKNDISIMGNNRDMMYQIDHNNEMNTFSFNNYDDLEIEYQNINSFINKNDLSSYYEIGEIKYSEEINKYEFKTYSCPNGAIKAALNLMKVGISDLSEISKILKYFNRYSNFVMDILLAYTSNSVFINHMPLTYYLLTRFPISYFEKQYILDI